MSCRNCGKETPENSQICEECAKKQTPLEIKEDDDGDLILIERKPKPDENYAWTGEYTPDQIADIRHTFDLSKEEIDILQEANNFMRNLLAELKVQDPSQLKENEALWKIYSARVQEFLNERNLRNEVIEALAQLQDGYDLQVLLKDENRKFGAALASLLFFLK